MLIKANGKVMFQKQWNKIKYLKVSFGLPWPIRAYWRSRFSIILVSSVDRITQPRKSCSFLWGPPLPNDLQLLPSHQNDQRLFSNDQNLEGRRRKGCYVGYQWQNMTSQVSLARRICEWTSSEWNGASAPIMCISLWWKWKSFQVNPVGMNRGAVIPENMLISLQNIVF